MVEEHWAYFAGFGWLVMGGGGGASTGAEAAAVVGWLFPLFIITAADANPRKAYEEAKKWCDERGWGVVWGRVPIFGGAVVATNALLTGVKLVMRTGVMFSGKKSGGSGRRRSGDKGGGGGGK